MGEKGEQRLSRGGSVWESVGVRPSRGPSSEPPTPHRFPHARRHPEAAPEVLRDAQHVPTETEPALLRVGVSEEPDLPREHRLGLQFRTRAGIRHLAKEHGSRGPRPDPGAEAGWGLGRRSPGLHRRAGTPLPGFALLPPGAILEGGLRSCPSPPPPSPPPYTHPSGLARDCAGQTGPTGARPGEREGERGFINCTVERGARDPSPLLMHRCLQPGC